MIRLAAFDLDGTVADTLRDLAQAVNHALAERGLSGHPVDAYRRFVGNGADNLIRTALGDAYTDENFRCVKEGFQAYYTAHSMDFTAPYDGMAEVLDALSRRGIMTTVISNKPHRFVPAILRAMYPDHRFDLGWGQQERFPRKPAPDALICAMDELGVTPDQTLYIGDSNVDVRFGHAAGVRVCGVEWGFRGREELAAEGADMIVSDPAELLDVILRDAKENI